jgi:uncharacterized protein YegL
MMAKAEKSELTDPESMLLAVVVDRSGSMNRIRSDMEGGLWTMIEEQKELPGSCFLTLTQFDTDFDVVHDRTPISEVERYVLVPRGSTALLDAMGRTMLIVSEGLKSGPKKKRPDRIVFAVITDGLENSSKEWTRAQVMQEVKRHASEGWQFTFLGADQDAIKEGQRVGVRSDASLSFSASPAGARAVGVGLSRAVRRYRSGETANLTYSSEERSEALAGES